MLSRLPALIVIQSCGGIKGLVVAGLIEGLARITRLTGIEFEAVKAQNGMAGD